MYSLLTRSIPVLQKHMTICSHGINYESLSSMRKDWKYHKKWNNQNENIVWCLVKWYTMPQGLYNALLYSTHLQSSPLSRSHCANSRVLFPVRLTDTTTWECSLVDVIVLTHWGRDQKDAISQTTFSSAFYWMKMYELQQKIPKGPVNNILALVQIMAWRCPGDKPLSEPMLVSLPTYICVTRAQRVNNMGQNVSVHIISPKINIWLESNIASVSEISKCC